VLRDLVEVSVCVENGQTLPDRDGGDQAVELAAQRDTRRPTTSVDGRSLFPVRESFDRHNRSTSEKAPELSKMGPIACARKQLHGDGVRERDFSRFEKPLELISEGSV